jgi:mannose-6-phosphate isomerase
MGPAHMPPWKDVARQPLRLARNRVYRTYRGGALLDRWQGVAQPADDHFPEEWVGSTTVSRLPGRPEDEGLSQVLLPDGSRAVLKELIEQDPATMLGMAHVSRHGTELAVLCKVLDSAMRLPIQVHPDRAFAKRHCRSDFGKTESWIILATRSVGGETPYILFGFQEEVTEEAFRRLAKTQDIPGQVAALNRVEVRPGEAYLVTAGTPHAIGPGVFMIEVQEPTDLVVNTEYTVGEIHRTEAQCMMGLPFDLGMQCFDYRAAGLEHVRRCRLAPRSISEDSGGREERLIGPEDTPCFAVNRLTVSGALPDRDRGRCYVGIVTGGTGWIDGPDDPIPVGPGTTFFVPAASEHRGYRAAQGPPLTLVKCFPPA